MPGLEGYRENASEAEKRQLDKFNELVLKQQAELAEITAASNGNFERTGKLLGKTTDEARTLGRQATSLSLRTMRQQKEQQLQALLRQRDNYQKSIQVNKTGRAAISAAKLPAPDQDTMVSIQNNPAEFMQKYAGLREQAQIAIDDPNVPYETKMTMTESLMAQAKLKDLADGKIEDINEPAPAGSLGAEVLSLIPKLIQARPVTADQIKTQAYQPGSIPGVGGGVTGLTSADSMNPAAVAAAQGIQSSLRQQAPMPDVVTGQNADQLQAFAGRGPGQGLQAPPGQQLTFTGSGSDFQAGYAPVGSQNPFAQMTRDPAMEAQIRANTLRPQVQYQPGNPIPAAPGQARPLEPPGAVTASDNTAVPPPPQASTLGRAVQAVLPVPGMFGETPPLPPRAYQSFGQSEGRNYERFPLTARDTYAQAHGEQAGVPRMVQYDTLRGATNQLIRATERATGKTGWINSAEFNPRDHVAAPMEGPPQSLMQQPPQAAQQPMVQPQAQPPVAQPGAAQPPAVPVDAVGARVQQLIQAGTPPATIAAELISRNIDPALYGLR